ncbi:MAG TPA: hypothetical protein VHT52_17795 [Stellaceae bacterium]|nr:hypothetical protein [Stellaceae bacterium]
MFRYATKTNTKRSINAYLGVPEDWPIVDRLKHAVILLPSATDIRRAKKQDPRACALHNCAVRTLGIPNAAIGAQYAYIPMRDAKGRPYIARLRATRTTAKAIDHFDATGEMPAGGFIFTPVAKTKTLEHIRKYDRGYVVNLNPRDADKRRASNNKAKAKYRRKPKRAIPRVFTEEEKG